MKELTSALLHIQKTGGRNDKIALLKKYAGVEGLKQYLQFVFDPFIRTGIAVAKLNKLEKQASQTAHVPVSLDEIIKHYTIHQTGSESDVMFAWHFINSFDTQEERAMAAALVCKDLKIGVTASTLNKVYGADFIPQFDIMLGEKYNECKDKVKPPYIATEKFDGIRRLIIKENGKVTLRSRTGIIDEGLVEIEEEAKYLPDNCVYDGELLAKGDFKDCIALRQATNSIANSSGIRKGVSFNVFDMLPLDEFKRGISEGTAMQRKILLGSLFKDETIGHIIDKYKACIEMYGIDYTFQSIKSVPILGVVTNDASLARIVEPIWKRGGEGVMLNTMHGKYELKRSKELLKVKKVESMDLPIIGFEEGTGKYTGMLGALVIDYKGVPVGVGSGLDDGLRKAIWDNQDAYLGRIIEIDTFGESTNKDGGVSLNCPIFKGIRYDK